MEASLTSSSSHSEVGGNKSDCSDLHDDIKGENKWKFREQRTTISSSSQDHKIDSLTEEDELELAKAEMTQVIDENARLKTLLEQIERDYQSLHKRFIGIMQQKSNKNYIIGQHTNHHVTEEPELVSLTLGRNPSEPKRDNEMSLKLGFDLNKGGSKLSEYMDVVTSDQSHEISSKLLETAEEEEEEKAMWGPSSSKVLKTTRPSGENDTQQMQPSAKRARVSVRARCDSANMNDGCQWRKYGQKIAKGNPCPRAYYRCTVAAGCPVRKQVQRCMDDMSILITTYEGNHNHPLSATATAMASTTSAAASMLLSGSSTSATTMPPTVFQGLNNNFSLTKDNISRPTPLYLHNASTQALSTITLDLTSSAPSRFSSSQTNTTSPSIWGNGYLNTYNKSVIGSFNAQPYQSFMDKSGQAYSQQILKETLTKAITSDPSLRSAINAAISSMVVGNGGDENKKSLQQVPLQFSL